MTATLSTHCLDTTTGLPAQELRVELAVLGPVAGPVAGPVVGSAADEPRVLEIAQTDADGRHRFVTDPAPGLYRLRFRTGDYLAGQDRDSLYPWVDITFTVAGGPGGARVTGGTAGPDHLHIPLLLSPYGYSTYRGS